MKRQQGISSLMVVSLLLVAVLMLSLASYRQVFLQIKLAKNQVQSAQQRWQAEGGLECAFAQMKSGEWDQSNWHQCGGDSNVSVTKADVGDGIYQLSATFKRETVHKSVSVGGGVKGAIQSSANIAMHSSLTISTPDPGKLTAAGWECIAVTYRKEFDTAAGLVNQGVVHGDAPWQGFKPQGADCAPTHLTNGTTLRSDIVKDQNIKPFESYFNVPVANYSQIRDGGKFKQLIGVGTPKILLNCGKVISDQIEAGHEFIWVEGGCEIKASEYSALTGASQNTHGVLLVFHDGPVSLMGSDSSGGIFKGSMVHFNTSYSPKLSDWSPFQAYAHLNHASNNFDKQFRDNASFYQHGAFTFSGVQIFDSPDHYALFYTSLNMRYNRDVMEYARSQLVQPRWKKGSWRDF